MVKYFIKQFVEDCKSLGWLESKVCPEWMDDMGVPVEEKYLEKVLRYPDRSFGVIMDYREKEEGIFIYLSSGTGYTGRGTVLNKEELETYLKISGLLKR